MLGYLLCYSSRVLGFLMVKMREDEFGAYFQFTPGWGKLASIARRK